MKYFILIFLVLLSTACFKSKRDSTDTESSVSVTDSDSISENQFVNTKTTNGLFIDSGNPDDKDHGWQLIRDEKAYAQFILLVESGFKTDRTIDWQSEMLFIASAWYVNNEYLDIKHIWIDDELINFEVSVPDSSFDSTREQRTKIAFVAAIVPNHPKKQKVRMAFHPF